MDSKSSKNSEKCKRYRERKRLREVADAHGRNELSEKTPLTKSERNRRYRERVKIRKLENSGIFPENSDSDIIFERARDTNGSNEVIQQEMDNPEMCRLCLKLTSSKINIFTDDFARMVELLTMIKISPDDNLSKISCLKCAKEVKAAFLVRRRIIQSHRSLTSKASSFQLTGASSSTSTIFDSPMRHLETILTETSSTVEEKTQKLHDFKLEINSRFSNILNRKKQSPLPTRPKPQPSTLFCTICQIKFPNRIKYYNHMCCHKKKTCPICNKVMRAGYLKKHLTLHEAVPAMCEFCGATCKNPMSLRMHIFLNHKNNKSVCEDCGRSFKSRTKLAYHRRKDHEKERNYKCETCGKAFFERLYLVKHVNMKHKKLRPEICEYCGKGFSGKHALRTHIRQHTNETPFHCDFCDQSFRQRVSLRSHLKNIHKFEEDNRFFCDKCNKGFATPMALDVHSRLHRELKCNLCSDTFGDQNYLDQHLINEHSENV